MMKQCVTLGIMVVVAAGLLLADGNVSAQKTQGKTRAAATKYLMRGINGAHCKSLGEALKDDGPADDKAWDAVACHAACLNEMGYLLMDDERCPDATWSDATKTLREGSAAVLQAAEDQDLDAARAAFASMTKSCGACHTAHKK